MSEPTEIITEAPIAPVEIVEPVEPFASVASAHSSRQVYEGNYNFDFNYRRVTLVSGKYSLRDFDEFYGDWIDDPGAEFTIYP